MKSILPALLIILFFGVAFTPAPKSSLDIAREKLANASFIKYNWTSLWPNPAELVDTTKGSSSFSRASRQFFDYDFIVKSPSYDIVYIDNNYSIANHESKMVSLYSEKDMRKGAAVREGSMIKSSPVTLLKLPRLTFFKDTVISGKALTDYRMIESDTVIDNNKIIVERHLYIGITSLLERTERRVIFNGKRGQIIVHLFSDYELGSKPKKLTTSLPPDYKSQLYGNREKRVLLTAGVKAPDFTLTDMNGKTVTLADLRGKKVLLDFSVINCGYCKLSLDHMNKKDFAFSKQLTPFYLNPEDGATAMSSFIKRVPVPLPVLLDAKEVAKAYGVSGFPTFFVIDEEGVIERVKEGFNEGFLDGLKFYDR